MSLRICFVASEIAPLAKTGGLADVAGALGRYLHRQGHDVRLFMPLHSSIDTSKLNVEPVAAVQDVALDLGAHSFAFSLYVTSLPASDAPVYLVSCPALFDRPALYSNAPDEHLRYLALQRAVLESCQRLQFAPHIMHCNDWHTALLPLLLKTRYAWDALFAETRTLLTIHNIGYQGTFPLATAPDIGVPVDSTLLHAAERAASRINWLRQGIVMADAVSTVSPTYAREICQPAGGFGLDDSLRARPDAVVGILNGVDYDEWNPGSDRLLPEHYSADDLAGKNKLKIRLTARFGLDANEGTPLAGIVSRLTVQKGFDLLFETLPELLGIRPLNLVVLGTGDPQYEEFFTKLQQQFPGRVAFHRGYHEELAHLIEAGSDLFLMPSLYEPCGLNQMYSLKYGTVPVVRRTGGLADSVQMWDPVTREGTGIVFNDFDANAMRWALGTALDLYADQPSWRQLMRNGMARDYSWETQGREYVKLYSTLSAQR